jgi:hypothetical protein
MATPSEIATGAAALRAYVQSISAIEAMFVPGSAFQIGATGVIDAADAGAEQSAAARQASGQAALRAALNSTGEGAEVSDAQCAAGTQAVLKAVAALRAQEDEAKGQA